MALPASTSFPAGGTWFDTLRRSFVDVAVDPDHDNAIPTTEFLEAAESLTTLFGSWQFIVTAATIFETVMLTLA